MGCRAVDCSKELTEGADCIRNSELWLKTFHFALKFGLLRLLYPYSKEFLENKHDVCGTASFLLIV